MASISWLFATLLIVSINAYSLMPAVAIPSVETIPWQVYDIVVVTGQPASKILSLTFTFEDINTAIRMTTQCSSALLSPEVYHPCVNSTVKFKYEANELYLSRTHINPKYDMITAAWCTTQLTR